LRIACISSLNITSQSEFGGLAKLGEQDTNISLTFRYHLKDVIVGKIYFLLVRIKIKHMELSIIRRETTGSRESFTVALRDVRLIKASCSSESIQ
jgi:hypothetical protein